MGNNKKNWKNENPNYRNVNSPKPLSENPATPPGYENTYLEYDNDKPLGTPVMEYDPMGVPRKIKK